LKNLDIHAGIEGRLENIRRRNRALSERRKSEVLEAIPQIGEIYSGYINESLAWLQKNLNTNNTDNFGLKKRNAETISKISALLSENGYPANYLDPVYECTACSDTGYITKNGRKTRCGCIGVYASKEIYSEAEFTLPADISFSFFDASLFSGYDSDSKKNKNEYMLSVKNLLSSFCQNQKPRNYYIFGKTGTGKTFLMVSMAKALLENMIPSLYITSNTLFKITQEYKASMFSDEKADPYLYDFIYSTRVLLIDDLGSEPVTPSRYSELLEILNHRIRKGISTIFASNLSPLDLKKMYDERICSRIIGTFDTIKLPGDDIRLVLKRRSKERQRSES